MKRNRIQDTFDKITGLFDTLPTDGEVDEQVNLLIQLYFRMSDSQKDEFLRETENA